MISGGAQDYLGTIVNNLWDEGDKGQSRVLLIHAQARVPDSVLIKPDSADILLLRGDAAGGYFHSPYAPFLDAIKDIFLSEGIKAERFVEEAGIYHYHRLIFTSWLSGSPAERSEDLIFEELPYERDRMHESLWLALERACKSKRVLLFQEGLESISPASAGFLRYLLDKRPPERMRFIGSFNCPDMEAFQRNQDGEHPIVELLEYIRVKGLLVEIPSPERSRSLDIEYAPNFKGIKAEQLLQRCHDALVFLALDECVRWSSRLHEMQGERQAFLTELERSTLMEILGEALYLKGNFDLALVNFQALLIEAQRLGDKALCTLCYRFIGAATLRKDNVEAAHQYALKALKLADELRDPKEIFRCLFLMFSIEDRVRKKDPEDWMVFYRRMSDLATKLGYTNALAFYYTNPYGLYSRYTLDIMKQHTKGLLLAKKYGNRFREASAYQLAGLAYSAKGKYDKVLKYYRKSEKIKLELGNRRELTYVCNGLGFYHYMIGYHREADSYFHRAMEYMRTLHDYHETVMTLFNIASNYFFSFHHEKAAATLEKMLMIIRILDMRVLAYHSLFGIYALIGVCHVKTGNISRAYEYLTAIQSRGLKPYEGKTEEYFMFEYLQALLAELAGKTAEAEAYYKKANEYVLMETDIIHYMAPRFYWEWGQSRFRAGDNKGRDKHLASGRAWAARMGNPFYKQLYAQNEEGSLAEPEPAPLADTRIDYESLLEFVRLEKNLNLLHRKNSEINFLNLLQSVLGEHDRRDVLIDKVMRLINGNFIMEYCYCFMRAEGFPDDSPQKWRTAFSLPEARLFDAHGLAASLATSGEPCILQRKDSLPEFETFAPMLNSVLCIPLSTSGSKRGAVLCATRREDLVLTQDDMAILSIACRQLEAALVRIDHEEEIIKKNNELEAANQKLAMMADIDLLTGVYNRQALDRKLDEEGKRLLRQRHPSAALSVCFADLDNFKYINDSFGHLAGDCILREFASLLRDQAREVDYVARYGGDEFVIVLPETDSTGAAILAQRIIDRVVASNSFSSSLEETLGRSLSVDPSRRLSCSIGIYSFPKDSRIEPETALRNADEALYLAKAEGKSRLAIYKG